MKKSLGAKVIVGTPPVWIVGTYDRGGKPNVMAAAWVGVCCSEPPCVAVALRKATYTYGNIQQRRAFTANIPPAQYVKEADYFGIASGKDVDKFSTARLTPVKSELVDAPYVQEFPLVLECRLLHTIEIGLHTQSSSARSWTSRQRNPSSVKSKGPRLKRSTPSFSAPRPWVTTGSASISGRPFQSERRCERYNRPSG
jgi:flavin reductase (DIM6/NTAB) family NADH-FMN oxidoreductase RutF